MQITPYGRVDANFDMLSKLGKVTPRQRKAMPEPKQPGPRELQSGAPQHAQESDARTDAALTPVGRDSQRPQDLPARQNPAAQQAPTPSQQQSAEGPREQGQAVALLSQRQTRQGGHNPASPQDPRAQQAFAVSGQQQGPAPQAGISAFPAIAGRISAATASKAANSVSGTPLSPALAKSKIRTPQQAPQQVEKPNYTPRSEKMLELAREQRDSVFRSIALSLTEQGGKAHFQLEPGELGSLGIELELKGEKLRLHVRVEREELAAVMKEDLGKLQAQLESRGLTVQEIDVQTSSRQEQQQAALSFREKHRPPAPRASNGTTDASDDAAQTGLLSRSLGLQLGSGINFLA